VSSVSAVIFFFAIAMEKATVSRTMNGGKEVDKSCNYQPERAVGRGTGDKK
jgi:hypothetical protein